MVSLSKEEKQKQRERQVDVVNKKIFITRKGALHECVVDPEHFEYLSQHIWSWVDGYARRKYKTYEGKPRNSTTSMQAEVLKLHNIEVPDGYVPDHRNRNKLDNRFDNLRVATYQENALNVSEDYKLLKKDIIKKATAKSAILPRSEKQLKHSLNNISKLNSRGTK